MTKQYYRRVFEAFGGIPRTFGVPPVCVQSVQKKLCGRFRTSEKQFSVEFRLEIVFPCDDTSLSQKWVIANVFVIPKVFFCKKLLQSFAGAAWHVWIIWSALVHLFLSKFTIFVLLVHAKMSEKKATNTYLHISIKGGGPFTSPLGFQKQTWSPCPLSFPLSCWLPWHYLGNQVNITIFA